MHPDGVLFYRRVFKWFICGQVADLVVLDRDTEIELTGITDDKLKDKIVNYFYPQRNICVQ